MSNDPTIDTGPGITRTLELVVDEGATPQYSESGDYADYGPEDTEPAPAITATYFEAKPYLAIDAYLEAGVLNLIASVDEAIALRNAIEDALADVGYITD